jgi:O-antigen ligase
VTTIRTLPPRAALLAALAAAAAALLALAASLRIGPAGLLAPGVAAAALMLLRRPRAGLALVVAFVVLLEGDGSGPVPGVDVVYEAVGGTITPLDLLLALVVAATALELVHRREPLRLPALLTLPLALFALGIVAGSVTGLARGASAVDVAYAGRSLLYLVILPVLVFNLVRTPRQLKAALWLGAAEAVVKAVVGLLTVATGQGADVEGSTITYYEPVANWLMMVAIVGVLAAVLLRVRDRLPLWLLLGTPLMLLSLVLSYRRSFWIGLALGVLLAIALGLSPAGRRMLVPTAALVAASLWALSTIGLQTQGPIVERVESLRPSQIASNAEDRYRLDERANVLAELRAQPIAGLGLAIGWSSAARPLPVEHESGRQYVHSVVLWHWLKLGVLGLAGYLALLWASLLMAWRTWRRHPDPLLRAGGLAMLCSLVAVAVVETTGSFTGVENRLTVAFGALLGLLAVAYRGARPARSSSTSAPTV